MCVIIFQLGEKYPGLDILITGLMPNIPGELILLFFLAKDLKI